ncbi:MAG: 6-phosphogluconolactonase, partial [Chitinophagaceae bacterium]
MAIHVFKNIDELSTGLADWIEKLVEKNLATTQRFTFALPGGNTPRKLFEVLSNSPFATSIDWKKIHFF